MFFTPSPGERVGGYELIEQLGHPGGFGVVWLARSLTHPAHQVAVKFLAPAAGNTGQAAESFHRELEVIRQLHCLHIARPIEADLEAKPPRIVYEYIKGRTLREHLHEGDLSAWDVFTIFRTVARALACLHHRTSAFPRGIVHRDVSADNIMVRPDRGKGLEGVIIDFGIAVLGASSELSRADMGKIGNYAPEQLAGSHITVAVDIWQFGATLVKALSGHRPFPPKRNPWEMLVALEGEPDLTRVPEPFVPLARGCLCAAPEERPTARAVEQQLSQIRNKVVPRERVRLMWVDTQVGSDGSIHRNGITVHLEGVRRGREHIVGLGVVDGRVPEVMIGDILTVPDDPPFDVEFYTLVAPDDVTARDGSETPIPALEACPSCGAPVPVDEDGVPQLWCPDPRSCPVPLRKRLQFVSEALALGLDEWDLEDLLEAHVLSDESELFGVTPQLISAVGRYRTLREDGRAELTEAGRELLARLEERRVMSHARALHAVGLYAYSILKAFGSVEKFLDAVRDDPRQLAAWTTPGASAAVRREPRVWETWACHVLERWAAAGVRFVDKEPVNLQETGR